MAPRFRRVTKALLLAWCVIVLTACRSPTYTPRDLQGETAGRLTFTYIMDDRTNQCFAFVGQHLGSTYSYAAIAHVPCTPEVLDLLYKPRCEGNCSAPDAKAENE